MLHTVNISVFGFKVIGKLSKKIYTKLITSLIYHRQPRLYIGVRWNLNFIRDCMKVNKIRSKLHSLKKFAILKNDSTFFVLCVLLYIYSLVEFGRVLDLKLVQLEI